MDKGDAWKAGDPGDAGVSAVIGTILILAITIVGIAALMLWGGPTIDRVQADNAASAMEGEFEGLRDASQELSVPDHSRFPAVALPRGEIAMTEGTRFLVAANHDATHPTCDLDVKGWAAAAPTSQVTVSATGCRALSSTSLEVDSISGTTISRVNATVSGGTVTA
ncbi:MAG: hypothetical protein LC620_08695, partial [Halobacteriales archaeon]|nr:hypothetical protein [Halobacteriales archaeon]